MTVGDITTMNRRIGRLRLDPTQVRGEGGLLSAALVLPLSVELEAQPAEQRLVVTEVRAELSLGAGSAHAGSRLGESVRVRGVGGDRGVWASIPSSTTSDAADLRFALAPLQVHALDTAATQPNRVVNLLVRFEVEAAWVRDEPQNVLGHSSGSALELLPLASVRASEITLPVPRSEWAEAILPALGMDALRLVGVRLPRQGGPLGDDLVAWFDQARHKFDAGDYRGAIERARDVRNAVEKRLQATRNDPVAAKVRDARGLPEDAATTAFLDGVWEALAEATNEAHHAGHPDQAFTASDARAVLLTTAVILEYLAATLSPGAL
jgi:hypothetical protein